MSVPASDLKPLQQLSDFRNCESPVRGHGPGIHLQETAQPKVLTSGTRMAILMAIIAKGKTYEIRQRGGS